MNVLWVVNSWRFGEGVGIVEGNFMYLRVLLKVILNFNFRNVFMRKFLYIVVFIVF